MTVLVVAAHPDDEVLGAGATMARFASEGRAVHSLILGEGATSRADRQADGDQAEVAALAEASREAAARLGTAPPVHAGFPDNRFDHVDLLDIVKVVAEQVARVRPTLVLTHHIGDLNIDHELTARAAITATRPEPGQSVRTVLSFEVPSATGWNFTAARPPFAATTFFDVTDTLTAKLHALEAYADELRPFPHARSLEAISAGAARWGSMVGVAAAEPFELVRTVR